MEDSPLSPVGSFRSDMVISSQHDGLRTAVSDEVPQPESSAQSRNGLAAWMTDGLYSAGGKDGHLTSRSM